MSKDDVLEYIGYEYVTSHMDKKKKTRMLVKPLGNLEVDGLDLKFFDSLLMLSTEMYLHLEDGNDTIMQQTINKILNQLSLVKQEYNKIFPNREKIIAHIFLDVEDDKSIYFLEAKSEKESFQVMKSNYLSNGKYYKKTTKHTPLGGILKIIQLTTTVSMVVLLIDLDV